MAFDIPLEVLRVFDMFGIAEAELNPVNFVFFIVLPYIVTTYALNFLMRHRLRIFRGGADFVNIVIPILIAFLALRLIMITFVISALYLMFVESWPFTQKIGPIKVSRGVLLIARLVFWILLLYLMYRLPPMLREML